MSADITSIPESADEVLAASDVARIWVRHLVSLLLPVNALAFLFTGPHAWYVSPLFMLPVVLAFVLDNSDRVERRQPAADLPAWPFDALVYFLASLQLAVVFGIGRMFSAQDLFSVDMVVLVTVVGGSSGFSIITAHELIHRRKPWERLLGRLLLCTVLQEHFFTEHLRGHHVRVGTPDDPATARFGESYRDFYRRTVPGQLRSAWQLEKRRLGDPGMSLLDPRMLRNRILHGVAVGWGMAFALAFVCGWVAFAAFVVQAFFASRLLEAVNYFEHWGLMRSGTRVRPRDSWDTHSWFTYYGLTGLSRHADHHYEPTRPFQQLRVQESVPLLPGGYVVTVDQVMTHNDEFQRLAAAELKRCGLGPFAPGAPEGAAAAAEAWLESGSAPSATSQPATGWRARWQQLPAWLRAGTVATLFLLGVTLGARLLGAGTAGTGFLAQLGINAWILAAFAAAFRLEHRIEGSGSGPLLGWSIALSLLVALGLAGEWVAALLV